MPYFISFGPLLFKLRLMIMMIMIMMTMNAEAPFMTYFIQPYFGPPVNSSNASIITCHPDSESEVEP